MIRTILPTFLFLLGTLSGWSSLSATESDPLLVGILATAVEPDVARQLELSDDQLQRLTEVIKDRESRGLALGQTLRELPPSERDAQQRQFVRESEKAGFALLNAQQKSRLQQMRLAKIGMLSLLDDEVAETLGLSEGQKEQVQKIADSRADLIREVGRAKAVPEMDLRMKSVLTLSQFATWQAMAGVSNRAKSGDGDGSSNAESSVAKVGSETAETSAINQAEGNADDPKGKSVIASDVTSSLDQAEDAAYSGLVLNFTKTPWESVLKWICGQADLTLMTSTFPPDTFTYSDRFRKYSVAEALDVMNGALLRDGYSLIRKGRGLMLLDLGESNAEKADLIRQYVREMSQLVTPEELDDRGEFELCKCLFFLGRLSASDAKNVVEDLLGPQGSVLAFEPAAQILVTETGGKLRLIRSMLKRIEDPTSSPGSKVVAIGLNHVTAEEVLAVARPLLSLQEGINTSADINLSTDTFGNTIFATGKADKLQTLKDVAEKVDVDPGESNSIAANGEKLVLRSHLVRGSDPETTFDIVQTMLSGVPSVRVTMDKVTNNIIAFCLPSDHDLIQKTLDEIAGRKSNFTIIPLKRIDPQAAILTLEKFFGKKSGSDKDASKGPIFYGDTPARTLMVQGTDDEVRQVNDLIEKLEKSGPQGSPFGDRYGFVPVSGRSADRLLDSMGIMWSQSEKRNPIKVYSTKGNEPRTDRRVPPSDKELSDRARKREEANRTKSKDETPDKTKPADAKPADVKSGDAKPAEAKPEVKKEETLGKSTEQSKSAIEIGSMAIGPIGFLESVIQQLSEVATNQLLFAMMYQPPTGDDLETKEIDATLQQQVPAGQEPIMVIPGADSKADIVIYRSPTGLIVTSNDKQALAEFQEMARMLSDQMALGNSEPTVIYLRFVKAQAAEELLKEILSGEASGGGGGNGLLGNVVGELGGGLIGGLLGGGRSSSSSSSSSSSDAGLAQGEYSIISDPRLNALIVKAAPMDMDLIEKLIDVIDQEDSPVDIETRGVPRIIQVENGDVETIATIVKESFKDRIAGADAGAAQRPPSPQELIQALRGGGGGGGGKNGPSQKKEAMMTIATDAKTNSLIVTSTLQLYEQVSDLVRVLDSASAENEEIISPIILPGNVNPIVIQNALQSTFGAQVRTNQLQQQQANNQRNQQNNRGQQGQGFQFPQGMQGMNFQFPQGGNRAGGQGGFGANPGAFGGNQGRGGMNQGFGNFGTQGFGNQGNRGGTNQNRGTNTNNNRTGGQRNR